MPPEQHNGEDFHYVVNWTRWDNGASGDSDTFGELGAVQSRNVTNWRQGELVIDGQPIYAEYELWVQAVNKEGAAKPQTLDRRIGYSGQAGQ